MMVNITIDGKKLAVEQGTGLLEAALQNGIYIPHLCHHPDLPELGSCRLCLVEREDNGEIVPSCTLPAEEGLSVKTGSERVVKLRKMAMELLLSAHPEDCTSCAKYGKCELQTLTQYIGVQATRMKTRAKGFQRQDHTLMFHELNRCVLCGRCVRACQKLRGVGAIDYKKREDLETYVGVVKGTYLRDADCRFCGACVAVCPTGSMQDMPGIFRDDIPQDQALVPCQVECPAHIDIPAYIRAVKEGRPGDAVGIIREKVPFPLVLGHICNHLCEGGCKRTDLNDPLSIRNLKRYAVAHDEQQAWKSKGFMKPRSGKSVAIVGGGPCGLTAAYYLNKLGHDVTVYEKRPQLGGPMTSGIPSYRLPLEGVMDEINYILSTGVKSEVNHEVRDVAELKRNFDAVLVSVGVSHGKKLPLPGSQLPQVHTAIDILAEVRAGKDMSYLGESVCVIGGGSVGYDCARTLVRKGIKVTLACLEQADKILADADDQKEAPEEGVTILPGRSFEAIEGEEKVTGLRVHTVISSTYDRATGKVTEVVEPDSQTTIPCSAVIFATGQHTGLQDYENFGIELNFRGFPVDPATGNSGFATSVPGIFAAGDAITGISFVIKAIAQARMVVPVIDQYLGGDGQIEETLVERERSAYIGPFPGFPELPRIAHDVVSPEERMAHPDDNVYKTYSCDQACAEANRCLQCDLRKDIHGRRVWSDYTADQEVGTNA